MSKSTDKAIDILFHLGKARKEISLARLAREIKMDKATTLRYLKVLEARHFVEKAGRGFSLGLALYELGSQVPVASIVVSRIKPFLHTLVNQTEESANLACLIDNYVVYLERVEPARSLGMRCAPGDRLPLHCTGVGKAILSLMPESRIRNLLGSGPLPKINDNTITNIEILVKEVERARQLGYSVDNEEYEKGLTCYAKGLYLPGSNFAGALSISGPTSRLRDSSNRDAFISSLTKAANEAQVALAVAKQ